MDLTNAQYTKIKNLISGSRLTREGIDLAFKNALGFERWEERLDKIGFAGIVLTAPTLKSPARLEIVWTTDGENGFYLDLDGINKKTDLINYIKSL